MERSRSTVAPMAPASTAQSLRLRGGKWSEAGPAHPHPLLARANAAGGSIYVLGGCTDVVDLSTCSNAVLRRTGDGNWERAPASRMGLLRGRHRRDWNAHFPVRRLLAQKSAPLANRAEAYVYETESNSWKKIRDLPHANRGLSAVALNDSAIALFGGYTDSGFTAATLVYDIASDAYRSAAPLPFAAAGIEFLRRADRIVALGGEDRMKSRSARVLEGILP